MGCKCRKWWNEVAGGSLRAAWSLAGVAAGLADQNDSGEDTIRMLQAAEATLADDNRRLVGANRELNAKKNKIKAVPATDRTSTGMVGRPRGTSPTINRRPQNIDRREVADMAECPKGHPLSGITDTYTREMISNWHFEREILGTLSVESLLLITSPDGQGDPRHNGERRAYGVPPLVPPVQ